jgi:hypothetical protein
MYWFEFAASPEETLTMWSPEKLALQVIGIHGWGTSW